MSVLDGLNEVQSAHEAPRVKELDETVWRAWRAKGRASDLRDEAARVKAVKLVATIGLFAAAILWGYLTPFGVLLRFIVALAATVVMVQAFHARRYVFAGVFGTIVLLYNPVVSLFDLSGDWQRIVVFASVVPFVASLAWSKEKAAPSD